MRAAVLVVLSACGVNVSGGPPGAAIDAAELALTDAAIDAPPCTGGDARVVAPDGSCLMLITAKQTWTAAKASCAALGAHAAVLPDAAMDDAAESLAGDNDTFIGLTDEATEGTFVWIDSTPLTFSNWHTGEPNDGNGRYAEDCAVIAGARAGKQWDDRPCAPVGIPGSGAYAVICQR